jgi:hypothetical protein
MALVLLASVGCGSSAAKNPLGPLATPSASNDPAISNATDDFQWAVNANNFSTNGGYPWRNTGTTARVTQTSSISAGSATLQIRDPGGRIVYLGSLNTNGTFTTDAYLGSVGDWRIDVVPSNVSGSVTFRVQKGG